MKKDIETYELIEQYLLGKLSDADAIKVENLINSDKKFAVEVERHKKLNDFIFDRSMVDIKEQIKNIHQQNSASLGGSLSNGKLLGFLGALITIGLVVGYILINKDDRVHEAEENIQAKEIKNFSMAKSVNHDSVIRPKETERTSIALKNEEQKVFIVGGTEIEAFDTTYKEINQRTEHKEDLIQNEISVSPVDDIQEKNKMVEMAVVASPIPEEMVNCDEIVISVNIETTNSCDNKASGRILVLEKSISGGIPPYQVSIDNGKNFYSRYVFDKLFSKLYKVKIRDNNNCESETNNLIVGSMDCTYEYAFAPDEGENWKIPTKERIGSIKIYNKTGQIIFQQTFDYPDEYYWYGRNNAGNELPMGAYMFILELDEEDSLHGMVTIVR